MKKYFIITSILLLASACSNQVSQVAPIQNQPQPILSTLTPPVSSGSSSSQTKAVAKPQVLTLNVYTDAADNFKVNYTSNFKAFSAAALKVNANRNINTVACDTDEDSLTDKGSLLVCFVLNDQAYADTNLSSAAVSVSKLSDKTGLTQCADFTSAGTQATAPISVNGSVFVTATASGGGAGNFYQIQLSRTFYNNSCYQINETVWSATAGDFSPPRQEFDKTAVWQQLDGLRGGVNFINTQPQAGADYPKIFLK